MAMETLFYYVGLVTVFWILGKLSIFTYLNFGPSRKYSLAHYKRGDESWAFITGASDGIGFGFAQELAGHGFNVVLLAHEQDRLEAAQANLEREFPGAKIKLLLVDAMTSSTEDLRKAFDTVKDLNITILVNNVGGLPVESTPFKPLKDYNMNEIDNTIYLNSRFLARISSIAIPVLIRNGPSLIVSLASGAYVGIPWLVMYSATKGFVMSFSKALAREMRAEGFPIDVVALAPGDVSSFSHRIPVSWSVPSSRMLAKSTLDRIGPVAGRTPLELCPYGPHALLLGLLNILPETLRQMGLVDEIRKKMKTIGKRE